MNKKFLSIFIALVLALSLCLVTAVPVAADDQESSGWTMATPTVVSVSPDEGNQGDTLSVVITGTGFAQGPGNVGKWQPYPGKSTVEYSAAQAYSPTYSVYLEALKANSPQDSAEVYVVPTGVTTLDDLTSVSFWYYAPTGGDPVPPQIDIWLDLDGDYSTTVPCSGDEDWLLGQFPEVTIFDTWVEVPLSDIGWIRSAGTIYGSGAAGLTNAKAETDSVGIYTRMGEFPVVGIGIQAGSQATRAVNRFGDQKFYVDDLKINDTIYAMEPLETASEVSFGTGITVNSYTVDSESQITADITIDVAAAGGTRNVSVTVPSAGTGIGIGLFTVLPVAVLDVMAPSAIDLGLMAKGTDTTEQSDPAGIVACNQPSWQVTAKDTKALPNTGHMVSGENALAHKFQISSDGTDYADADSGITYDNVNTLPFHVKQHVADIDPAGSYKITITFTGWY